VSESPASQDALDPGEPDRADTQHGASPADQETPGRGHNVLRNAVYVALLIVSVVLLYFVAVRDLRNFLVPSSSMRPTLYPTDYIYTLSETDYEPGDIVVLRDPDPSSDTSYVVKRIVAVGGQSVRIQWGALYVNGAYVSEPYIMEPMGYDFPESGGAFSVPEGDVFVLGDNRNASEDSSAWGPELGLSYSVPVDSIIGRVRGVYLPFRRIRVPRSYPLRGVDEFGTDPSEVEPPPGAKAEDFKG